MQLYNFSRHEGVSLLSPPKDLLKSNLLGNVVAHNLVNNKRRHAALETHISDYFWHRRMLMGFSLKTTIAEISNPGFKKSYLTSNGRVLLNGAAGDRARNFIRKRMQYSEESVAFFKDYFSELADPYIFSGRDPVVSNPVWIEAKNYFNFFHFMTESLHKAYLPDNALKEADSISFFSRTEDVHDFVMSWIHAGIALGHPIPTPLTNKRAVLADRVLTPLSAKHLLYQFSGPHHEAIERARPAGRSWEGYDATPHPVTILALNSYDDSLENYRRQMIDLAKRTVAKRWGRKIYIARSPELRRKREMPGEDRLIDALSSRGFEVVYFEQLTPLEQVRCVSGARCLIMQHGAGMANMLFASPNAHVFELGTYQTAMARWGDFMPLCHASGCHYHHVFLDMCYDNENEDPVFSRDGLVAPVISDVDVEKVVELASIALRDKRGGKISGLVAHADYFMARQAYRQSYRLLDAVQDLVTDSHGYWETRARLNELSGHIGAAANSFMKVWEISGSEAAKRNFLRLTDDTDSRRSKLG